MSLASIIGSASVEFLDGTRQIYAANSTTIFRASAGTWVQAGGGLTSPYGATYRWRFALFGDDIIATDFNDPVQVARGPNGDFAPLGGNPPRAQIVETVANFVFLCNTEHSPNQWWCSGIGADTLWSPDVATQAANNTLVTTQGGISAARRFGETLVIYKKRSMYLGQYYGPPAIWGFQLISSEAGAPGQEAVVQLGDMHVFPCGSSANFWLFDGGLPRPLQMPSSVREFFFKDSLDIDRANRIIGRWDQKLGVVTWHYPSKLANPIGTLDSEIKWHIHTGKWTLRKRIVEYVMLPYMPLEDGITYDEFGSHFTTYGQDIPITYHDPLFVGHSTLTQGVFLQDHALYTLTGVPGATSFLTGDIGDEAFFTYIRRLKPKFNKTPSVMPTLTEYYKTNLGDDVVLGETKTLAGEHWFNLRRRARFHRYLYRATGDYEIIGLEPDVIEGGRR